MDSIIIERVFKAPREKVWQAWTEPEQVKQWWGPEGFTAPSIKIDLKAGGKYVYAMHGPKGTQWDKDMYSAGIFEEIIPQEKIVTTDYFSDSEGNKADPKEHGLTGDMPVEMKVIITFEDTPDGGTKVTLTYPKPDNQAQFEAMLKSGMQEGWQSSFNKMSKLF